MRAKSRSRRTPTTAADPLTAALRKALADPGTDPRIRAWVEKLLAGDGPARRKGARP